MMNRVFHQRLAIVGVVISCGVLSALPGTALAAAPTLKLSVAVGPPTTQTKAIGSGYPASDSVTVTFDGTTVAATTTSATGKFSVSFHVPASALPGSHTVSAFDPAGVGASTTFLVRTNWAAAHFDDTGSGFNPYENVLSASNAGDLQEVAKPTLKGGVRSEPIYAGGTLFNGDGHAVQAVSPSGRVLWTFTTKGAVLGSPLYPPSPCQVVVAESQDGNVYGLNPANGTKLWSFAAGSPFSGSPVALLPAVQHGTEVVAIADNGSVYALNACTGALSWSDLTTETPGQPVTPAILTAAQSSDGTTHTIVVWFHGATIEGLDALTGNSLWSVTESEPIDAGPAVYGSGKAARVLFGTGSGVVELIGGSGAPVWTEPTPAAVSGISLFSTTGTTATGALKTSLKSVIVGDGDGDVYSLVPSTGAINWGDHEAGPVDGDPAIGNGVIYLTTAPNGPNAPGALVGLNALNGGGILNSDELNPQPYPPGPPSIGDGQVFVGEFDSSLAIFALPAGAS